MTNWRRWAFLVSVLLFATLVIASNNWRLALSSNEALAASVLRTIDGAQRVDSVRRRLLARYVLVSESPGTGSWFARGVQSRFDINEELDHYSFHIVLGKYRGVPFKMTVDAMVLVGPDGLAKKVMVRRSGEGT